MKNKAKYVKEITVVDPDTGNDITLSIFKHENGGMFGIDSTYVDQVLDEDKPSIPDPFCDVNDIKQDIGKVPYEYKLYLVD